MQRRVFATQSVSGTVSRLVFVSQSSSWAKDHLAESSDPTCVLALNVSCKRAKSLADGGDEMRAATSEGRSIKGSRMSSGSGVKVASRKGDVIVFGRASAMSSSGVTAFGTDREARRGLVARSLEKEDAKLRRVGGGALSWMAGGAPTRMMDSRDDVSVSFSTTFFAHGSLAERDPRRVVRRRVGFIMASANVNSCP